MSTPSVPVAPRTRWRGGGCSRVLLLRPVPGPHRGV